MLFNSVDFFIFLPVVFVLYWFVFHQNLKKQNILLLIASYFFYACWDWRFLFLLIFSTSLDYYTGIKIFEASKPSSKKIWMWLSILSNLSFLGVFKYYNFFADSFVSFLSNLGFTTHLSTIQWVLPVGISFYTFHGLSYVIDLYNQKIKPERDVINYSLFVCFFPLLVAGPIERATHLLPQIKQKRTFNYAQATDGLKQMLWGLFKKVVIADQCATFVNTIFDHYSAYSASTLVLGLLFFSFQIYGDFSGYSDIALGTAKLFGIDLLRNFSFPFFSRNIAEFWRRWHISLSSWFRDYLYIPLGGSNGSLKMKIRNTFIVFLVSGLWHGANWTFVLWGLLHALYFLPLLLYQNNRSYLNTVAAGKFLPSIKELLFMLFTFVLVSLAWVFFRAPNLTVALEYAYKIFSKSIFELPYFLGIKQALVTSIWIVFMLLIEWISRESQYGTQNITLRWKRPYRWLFYYSIALLIFLFGAKNQPFIYFQF
ncbi:MBOAT family protein [Flavobacterium sp. CYK-55]|uniref:MBOAT family O-acyltransferase n=1 Tax=Flavobacterium sp. CYK-55 TaxID=2835529 RepID=UPI001BCE4937|nr:MBOAT family O-acyltransferase [Flavobacterium sp. CYK-55]MBS7786922.1 MBOAT family protein [Flavobacterium sp. CYK-55]